MSLVLRGKYNVRHYMTLYDDICGIVFNIFIRKTYELRYAYTIGVKVEIEFKNKYLNIEMAQYFFCLEGYFLQQSKKENEQIKMILLYSKSRAQTTSKPNKAHDR